MNRWFDTLKDPKRFLVFFIPTSALIVTTMSAPAPFNVIAGGIILIMLITRMLYILKGNNGGR